MKHLTEQQLTSVFQDTLPAGTEERILLHLARCESCERGTEPSIERYRTLRREASQLVPRPPHPWRDIRLEMDRADGLFPLLAGSESAPKRRRLWAGLVTAAAVACLLILWPWPDTRPRADVLLPRIEMAVSRAPSRARHVLRVRTSTGTFVRPALLTAADGSDRPWRDRFRAAHYNWDDPVSPRAFSVWRNGVEHKSDRVVVSPASSAAPGQLTIQTTAQGGILHEASLTVDAASLLPVSARFVFAGEQWLEISVMPGLPLEKEAAVVPSRAPRKSAEDSEPHRGVPQSAPGRQAAIELAVWLIADRLSDPAGDPIRLEIRAGDRISVTPYSLSASQLQQLSASLQGMSGVALRAPDAAKPGIEILQERDPAIDLSETIFSRVHLLADLAEHFPYAVEMDLALPDRVELWRLRSRQASRLTQEIQSLQTRSKTPDLDSATGGVGEAVTGGGSLMERLVQAAGRVNRSVTIASAGGVAGSEAGPARLANDIARLKNLADQYAASVAESLEKLR